MGKRRRQNQDKGLKERQGDEEEMESSEETADRKETQKEEETISANKTKDNSQAVDIVNNSTSARSEVNKEYVILKNKKPTLVKDIKELGLSTKANKTRFEYPHRGDFVVSASLCDESCTSRGQANFLKIVNAIAKTNYKPSKIIKTGFKTVDLFFNNMESANKILRDTKISSTLKCAILNRNVTSRGVIADWDDNIMNLGEVIDYKENIVSLERMIRNRYNVTEKRFFPTKTNNILITFKGKTIPDSISLYGGLVKLKVRTYIPMVRQCFNCYRFGHTKALCKTKNKLCIVCGDSFHGHCDRTAKCINCHKEHKANSKSCEHYNFNREVTKLSVINGISIYEAKSIIKDRGNKAHTIPNVWNNPEEWPRLNERNRNTGVALNNQRTSTRKENDSDYTNFKIFVQRTSEYVNKIDINKEQEDDLRKLLNMLINKLKDIPKNQDPINNQVSNNYKIKQYKIKENKNTTNSSNRVTDILYESTDDEDNDFY
ncbi:uncharacterized protein [Cardiocondyla obscurior]|uniref:uncharacterized protein n=1 Tax=Cardiocondyla obscurior TaxID=286306 RepID=UPI0039657A56